MTDEELAHEKQLAKEKAAASEVGASDEAYHANKMIGVYLAWAAVGIPLSWGVYRTFLSVTKFFH